MQVVWDVKKGEALCGAPLLATDVRCFHSNAQRFATCGGDSALHIWQLDAATHKLARSDIQVEPSYHRTVKSTCTIAGRALHLRLTQGMCLQLGQYKRNFTRLLVTQDDQNLFVGSTSGDIAQVSHCIRDIILLWRACSESLGPVSISFYK